MGATIGALGRFGHIDHVHFRGQTLNVFGRAFEQQSVAHAHHQIVQLPTDIAIASVYGQRIDPEAASQAHGAQSAPHHFGIWRDQRFNSGGFHGGDLIHALEAFCALQAEKLGHLRAQNHTVAHL